MITALLPLLLRKSDLLDLPAARELLERPAVVDVTRTMGSERMLDLFVPSYRGTFDGERQSIVLQLIENSPRQIRRAILERVEEMARRLASREREDLPPPAFANWARLLGEAKDVGVRSALRAFVLSLHFTLERRPHGASVLVLASFPTVYVAACSDEPSMKVESLFSFFDWDRAKTLRAELVTAYVNSDWPPEELMLVAHMSDIGRQILKRLARESAGRHYIERMKTALAGRSDTLGASAHNAILDFENNPPGWLEWD